VGEVILRDRLHKQGFLNWTVASAGTWGLDGHHASPHSVTVMADNGFDIGEHIAQTVSEKMLAEADLVLCMESGHVEALQAEFPRYRDKIFLLSEMIGKRYSISDPYGGALEGYQRMAQEVTNLIDNGLQRIIALTQVEK
jgi:protein-tyrosine phosphatase